MAVEDIRFRRLGYVSLTVSDLAQSLEFYTTELGLCLDTPPQDGVAFLRCSAKHHDVMLTAADAPGLQRVGWEMESPAALAAAREHLEAIGVQCTALSAEEAEKLGIGPGFRFDEPTTGLEFEFYTDMLPASEFTPTHTEFRKLGHIVVTTPDPAAGEAFMRDHLNFRISDRIGELVTFLRCHPDPYHHSFAFARDETVHLHHVNFMVTQMRDIGRGNNRMKRAGSEIVFGPGQHPASESVFLYFLDPDGMTLEYSFGMEEFPEDNPREPRTFPVKPESFDWWDGRPSSKFARKGELQKHLPHPAQI